MENKEGNRLAKRTLDTEKTEKSSKKHRKMQHKVKVEVSNPNKGQKNDMNARLDHKVG